MRVLLVSANREHLPSPVVPIGILSVAAAIKESHDVRVVDLCFEDDPKATLREALAKEKPDVVGLGMRNLHTNAYDGTEGILREYAELAAVIRETPAKLVLGGAAFSLQPETMLKLLDAHHGIVGEGETAFPRLLGALDGAPRIIAPKREELVSLRSRFPLDALPLVDRALVDRRYYAYDGTDNVQTKRGCAFECAYCDYPDLEGNRVRLRDPEKVADEVAASPGEYVFMVDSVFNVPRSHAIATCNALVARGRPRPWVAYVSPASFDEDVARAMADARCEGVEIGSDAGTEEQLTRLRKPFTLKTVRRAHTLLKDNGIKDAHTFVLGYDGETADDVQRTLDFVDELDPHLAIFMVFTEDRELSAHRAMHRDRILELLKKVAPLRPGWVVPELGVRFGAKIEHIVRTRGLRGPAWLHLPRGQSFQTRGELEPPRARSTAPHIDRS